MRRQTSSFYQVISTFTGFMNTAGLCCVAILGTLLSGCGKVASTTEPTPETSPATTPAIETIAVINLNVVAQEIGAMDKINVILNEKKDHLVGQLNDLKSQLGKKRDEIQTQFGTDLNEQQQGELDQMLVEHQNTLQLQTQAANSQLATTHAQLKRVLLDQVRPVAFEVAKEHGMNIVLTTGQIFAAGNNIEITQQVIERIRELNEAGKIEETSALQSPAPSERVANLPGGGAFMPQ